MANLLGRSGTAASIPTSETVGTSVPDPKVGSRWFDGDNNEYVVVDCQQAFVAGEWVFIDHNHLATRMTDSGVASRVGVIVAAVSASDTKAYAQIYGLYSGAAGTSNVAITKFMSVPSGTSDIGVISGFASSDAAGVQVYNAYAVTAPDSGATSAYATSFVSAGSSATTYIGFQVWLNYPFTQGAGGFIGQTS
jgi:hypothetical protein